MYVDSRTPSLCVLFAARTDPLELICLFHSPLSVYFSCLSPSVYLMSHSFLSSPSCFHSYPLIRKTVTTESCLGLMESEGRFSFRHLLQSRGQGLRSNPDLDQTAGYEATLFKRTPTRQSVRFASFSFCGGLFKKKLSYFLLFHNKRKQNKTA